MKKKKEGIERMIKGDKGAKRGSTHSPKREGKIRIG